MPEGVKKEVHNGKNQLDTGFSLRAGNGFRLDSFLHSSSLFFRRGIFGRRVGSHAKPKRWRAPVFVLHKPRGGHLGDLALRNSPGARRPGAKDGNRGGGVAWWFIVSLQSGKWVALGFVPTRAALGLLLPTLPAIIAATLVGAWLYKDRD